MKACGPPDARGVIQVLIDGDYIAIDSKSDSLRILKKGFGFLKKDSNEVVSFKVLNWSLPIAAKSLGRFVRQLMPY